MPTLRSPIDAMRYAIAQRQVAQETGRAIGAPIGAGISRGIGMAEDRRRDKAAEMRHADEMALRNEQFITESNFREDQAQQAKDYRDTLQAQHKQERMEDISRERGRDLAAEARYAQGFAEEKRQFGEREGRLAKTEEAESMARGAGSLFGGIGKVVSGVSDWRKESARQEEKGREEDRANARIMLSATQQQRAAYEADTKGYESLLDRHEKRLKALADAGDSDLIRTLTPEFRAKLKEQYGDRLTDPKLAALVKALDARDRLEQVIEHRRTSGPGVATDEPMAEPGPTDEEDELSGFEAEFESAGG